MTDSKSAEQRADEVVSGKIDCQLTGKLHYADRPQPQHADLHITNVLITTYESLSGTNLPGPLLTLAPFFLWDLWAKHTTEIHSVKLVDKLQMKQKPHLTSCYISTYTHIRVKEMQNTESRSYGKDSNIVHLIIGLHDT